MSGPPIRPPAYCPKCGYEYGFLHSKPEWHRGDDATRPGRHSTTEHLDWRCDVCDYGVETPTADAEAPA